MVPPSVGENVTQCGLGAVLISAITLLVAVSITDTAARSWLGTNRRVPSGLTAGRNGWGGPVRAYPLATVTIIAQRLVLWRVGRIATRSGFEVDYHYRRRARRE